jgi:cytochrome P450
MDLLAKVETGEIDEADLPHDILTSLLRNRDDPRLGLTDDGLIVREAGTYLQGGTHTSSQTLINAVDLLIEARDSRPDFWNRAQDDLAFAQRCMHETLRLRPTTPKAKRRAEANTSVGGVVIPEGALVILDLVTANRDPSLFGEDADTFNPDRSLPSRNPLWGLSFGAGPHICPGRKVAGGLQQVNNAATESESHLFGLVAMMIQSVVRRNPQRHETKPQAVDDRTERFTRWREYWVTFQPVE